MIAFNIEATAPTETEVFERPRMRGMPAHTPDLVRHCRWHLRAGRIAIACAIARMTLEIHLKQIAGPRVKCRKTKASIIALRLRDAGWITFGECGAVDYAYDHLSSLIHGGKVPARPAVVIEQAMKFVEATQPDELRRRGRMPVVA